MREREVKLGVWPGFRLPDLDGVVDGAVAGEPTELDLEAVYYDTLDVRLARAGVSLRYRRGDGTGWTLKLPDDGPAAEGELIRTELTFAGGPEMVPDEVRSLVTPWVRAAALVEVARLCTRRHAVDVLDADGNRLAEIVDDEVSVMDGDRVALRFREVEAEAGEGAPDGVLEAIVDRLRAAGAGPPDPTSKVKRALGPHASGPPDLPDVRPSKTAAAADVLRAGLVRSTRKVIEHDVGVRQDRHAEDVHQARVATRRLRSDLRTYRSLLDQAWADSLRSDLKPVADALGAVRDTDVLIERLARSLATLPAAADEAAGAELLTRLTTQRLEARTELLRVLGGPSYGELLERLVVGSREPHLSAEAARPAAKVLPALVERPWLHLAKAADTVGPEAPDAALHEVRIRAKRCRYAAEVAAITVGGPAKRLAKAVENVQEVLGEHQDAVVAEAWLRDAAAAASPAAALVAGELIAIERERAQVARDAFPAAWRAARKGKLRAWLT
jgi:CHAD domain-containing protein